MQIRKKSVFFKLILSFLGLIIFMCMGCDSSNQLAGHTYKGNDSLYSTDIIVEFSDKICVCTIFKVRYNCGYKLDKKSLTGNIYNLDDKEPFATLKYSEDGSWIGIVTSDKKINSKKLNKIK